MAKWGKTVLTSLRFGNLEKDNYLFSDLCGEKGKHDSNF